MDDFEFDDFELMCIEEHYREYWYLYDDWESDGTENEQLSDVGQDTNIPMQIMPKGSGKVFFVNNWKEHHGTY